MRKKYSYTEKWKPIKHYANRYEVSNEGRIKSLQRRIKHSSGYRVIKERILKPSKQSSGYPFVLLYKNGKAECKLIHRAMAEAFIPNTERKPCINHLDGDKEHNRLDNLEWCTHEENTAHAMALGLFVPWFYYYRN